ncbi:MAG TPA: NAD-dependent epimerase/dehydratase family protein [Stellaceae bacterium]|nr:NAD-dependent epimerase/dehydratase family protein [Stellaceae bacterium]
MRCGKVLITGATGFIGSRLCERLSLHYRVPYRALVHNFGKAARIGRLGAEMVAGDLDDKASLSSALSGCDGVVHLAYGNNAGRAEKILLSACREAGIKRFVHISSMAVHGPNPGPECAREATATIGRYGEPYSDAKARAERVVQRAIDGGMPGIILRPTVVYGPYSPFVTRIVQDARAGAVSLIDEGKGVCNAVYVDDVCDAIYAALETDRGLGKAFFVNADRAVSWRDFNTTFAEMVRPLPRILNVSADAARAYWRSARPSLRSNLTALKRLAMSSDFHDQLATVPALRSAIRWTKVNLKKALSADRVNALKNIGAEHASPAAWTAWPDQGRIVREDFHLEFSNELAKTLLGWRPAYDFVAGAAVTRSWLEFARMLES